MFSHTYNVLYTAFSGEYVPGRVLVFLQACIGKSIFLQGRALNQNLGSNVLE